MGNRYIIHGGFYGAMAHFHTVAISEEDAILQWIQHFKDKLGADPRRNWMPKATNIDDPRFFYMREYWRKNGHSYFSEGY